MHFHWWLQFLGFFALFWAGANGHNCRQLESSASNRSWSVKYLTDSKHNGTIAFPSKTNFLLTIESVSELDEDDLLNGKLSVCVEESRSWLNLIPTLNGSMVQNFVKEGKLDKVPIQLYSDTFGDAYVSLVIEGGRKGTLRSNPIRIEVLKKQTVLDSCFPAIVVLLMTIMFINFGCAMDPQILKQAIKRPIGPLIGVINHFLILPLIAWSCGGLLFEDPNLRLGMFYTAVSPAGGGSNVWTALLGGNLTLSIAMTTVSTLFSFITIPAWVAWVRTTITGEKSVGYSKLAHYLFLLIPLAVGYLMQLYCKRLAKIMIKILKPLSIGCIVFIIVLATIVHFEILCIFSWQITVSGVIIPFCGYLVGLVLATICRQSSEDILAISIESGVQNSGVAIFLIQSSMNAVDSLHTTAVPVAVSLMTPIPLIVFYFIRRRMGYTQKVSLDQNGVNETDVSHDLVQEKVC